MSRHPEIDWPFRVGAALLASAAGAAIGLALGTFFVYLGWSQSIGRPVAGAAIAGALSGALLPVGAMDFVEGTVHFFFGFVTASFKAAIDDSSFDSLQGSPERPEWLRWAFIFGALLAIGIWVATQL